MFKRFYPKKDVKTVFELNEEFFSTYNIRGAIFDIDNTLVTHDTPTPPEDILNYFATLENMGIKIAIVSNNHAPRVELFCRDLGYPYIARAWKPFKKNLRIIQDKLDLPAEEIALVGDQIFTDIYGGNRMKFYSVLVTAVGKNETNLVAIKRYFEKLVLWEYRRSLKKQKNGRK